MNDCSSLFDRLPVGWSVVVYEGRRYGVTRTVHGDGRSQSVYAEAARRERRGQRQPLRLGGDGVLRPCEMPAEKVLGFLRGLEPDAG